MKSWKLFCLIMLGLFLSCERSGDPSMYSFSGKAQKGPFVVGSTVTLYELNSNLVQTGRSFQTTIFSHDGSFELPDVELHSSLALLESQGYFFYENRGQISSGPLKLQAYTDLTDKEQININILTHVSRGRIEKHIEEGKSFTEAKNLAESEFLAAIGCSDDNYTSFENCDISESSDANALLLAFSVISQKTAVYMDEIPTLAAQLSVLLTEIAMDFKVDGIINDQYVINQLLSNISYLNFLKLRNNIEKRYEDIGFEIDIPDFEKYVAKFQRKFNGDIYTSYVYPDSASPDPYTSPEAIVQNVLDPDITEFKANWPYCIAAITPLEKSLVITMEKLSGGWGFSMPIIGWEIECADLCTLTSHKENELITGLFYLDAPGSANIHYYEDGAGSPTFSKTITWK